MTRALVLGGGGITGIGWEVGLLAGLADAGLDLTDADTVIGTSAGSVVGAQLTSGSSLQELYAEQLAEPSGEIAAHLGPLTLLRLASLLVLPGSPRTRRSRLGRAALDASKVPVEDRLEVIRGRLPRDSWPERDLRITAVDARSGRFVVFDRTGPADLVHAVAASCAVPLVWPPVPIDGRSYVDGGVRSSANADLAKGADRVVVLAPIPRSLSKAHSLTAQLARTGAPDTIAVSPDEAARAAIGRDVLDPRRRGHAARAGYAQAAAAAEAMRPVWGVTGRT
jgi:NTE family protein